MVKYEIDESRCKGCGLCVRACPKKILALSDKLNTKGYHPVGITDVEACTACAACARTCPDTAIRIEKE